MKRSIMLIVLRPTPYLLLLFLTFYLVNAQKKTVDKQIDSIFSAYDNAKTPGVAVSVIKNGKVGFRKGYGSANLEHEIPIHTNTVFNLCSVSKQFTVFALLLLEEEGKLALDDDIQEYIPELNDFGDIITLRHLASNSSGLRSDLQLLGMKGYTPDNVITQEEINQITLRQSRLNFKPGSAFGYSNSGFNLLANVIVKVSGVSFATYIEENIFKPLKMNHSYVMNDFHKIIKNKAYSYELENGSFQFAPTNYSYTGASGIYTTLLDFEKWALNFRNLKIGSKAIFDKMNTLTILNSGQVSNYALGQFVDTYNGLKRIWHSGADAGYRSYLGRFSDQDISVLLLSNNASVYAEGEALKVIDIFLKPYFKKKASSHTPKKFRKPSSKLLAAFSGSYLHSNSYYIRDILVRNDALIYSRPDQSGRESVLYAKGKNKFQLGQWEDTMVEFLTEGKVKTMNILVDEVVVDTFKKYTPIKYSNKDLMEFEGSFHSDELDATYKLQIKDSILSVKHSKILVIGLKPIRRDGFLSNGWQFRFLEFVRDNNNTIAGFKISSDRAKEVFFKKK